MTECDDIRRRLDGWLDRTLSNESAATINAHCRQCNACAAWFQTQRAVDREIRSLGTLADALASSSRRPMNRLIPIIRFTQVAAAIVFSTLIAWWSFFVCPPATRIGHLVESSNVNLGLRPIPVAERAAQLLILDKPDYLSVTVAARNPRIHIVWIYDAPGPADSGSDDHTVSLQDN